MGLADKLHEVTASSHQKQAGCKMAQLMAGFCAEDFEALQSAFASPASTRSIHQVLLSEGHVIDRATVTAHRKGFCRCKETTND
jgi:hypothetical protein